MHFVFIEHGLCAPSLTPLFDFILPNRPLSFPHSELPAVLFLRSFRRFSLTGRYLLCRKSIRYTVSSEKVFFFAAPREKFSLFIFFFIFNSIFIGFAWTGWNGRKMQFIWWSVGRMDKSRCVSDLRYLYLDDCRRTGDTHAEREKIIAFTVHCVCVRSARGPIDL